MNEPELPRETRKQATERRIAALEAHIVDLEERLHELTAETNRLTALGHAPYDHGSEAWAREVWPDGTSEALRLRAYPPGSGPG